MPMMTPIMAAPVSAVSPMAAPGAFNFSAELLGVMQEMIRKEVRSYMEQQNGMCYQGGEDGFRNASVKRIGISRIDS